MDRQQLLQHNKYADKEYWEQRYSKTTAPFQWLQCWSSLSPTLSKHLSASYQVLNVGCGTSTLEVSILENNLCKEIVSIDISDRLIKERISRPGLKYIAMDCTKMEFGDGIFDAVLDKSTLDSVVCAGEQRGRNYVSEVERVLKDNGKFIVVSYASPTERLKYFQNFNVNYEIIGGKSFIYICRKPGKQECKQPEEDLMEM